MKSEGKAKGRVAGGRSTLTLRESGRGQVHVNPQGEWPGAGTLTLRESDGGQAR